MFQKHFDSEGGCEHHYKLSFRQQLSSELVSALLFPFLLIMVRIKRFLDVKVMGVEVAMHVKDCEVKVCMDKVCSDKVR